MSELLTLHVEWVSWVEDPNMPRRPHTHHAVIRTPILPPVGSVLSLGRTKVSAQGYTTWEEELQVKGYDFRGVLPPGFLDPDDVTPVLVCTLFKDDLPEE